jgi:hypothetical protein
MATERMILAQLDSDAYLLVDRDTNEAWKPAELDQFGNSWQLEAEDELVPADAFHAVSGPYPGCPQMGGRTPGQSSWRLIGQTRHFLVFAGPGVASPAVR